MNSHFRNNNLLKYYVVDWISKKFSNSVLTTKSLLYYIFYSNLACVYQPFKTSTNFILLTKIIPWPLNLSASFSNWYIDFSLVIFLSVMINGGLRLYNARLDIGGFVSTVRSGRTATVVVGSPAWLFSSFLISSVPLVAVSVPCPLHDCPYYESLYHFLYRWLCVYARVYVCVLCAAVWTMKFLGSRNLRAVRERAVIASCVSCVDLCLVSSCLISRTPAENYL